ncbi:hypothetical protein T06_14816 [Trichinella sp. T6]|nr:hypothetical protein T06_14816 [Trichinella sp. T6]
MVRLDLPLMHNSEYCAAPKGELSTSDSARPLQELCQL